MSGSTQAVANTSKDLNMVEKVPFFNYPVLYTKEREKYLEIMDDVLSRGAFIMQKDLEEFESSLVDFTESSMHWALRIAPMVWLLAYGPAESDRGMKSLYRPTPLLPHRAL